MELLETQDPERKKLIETSDRHKRELEKEVKAVSDKTEKMLKNALIIGGALALTYFSVSQLTKTKTSKKKTKKIKSVDEEAEEVEEAEPSAPSFVSQIGDRVISQASLVLLDIAKDMLTDYLESRKKPHENS